MRNLAIPFAILLSAAGCSSENNFQSVNDKNKVGDLEISGRACDAGFDTWVDGANVYTHLIDYSGRIYKTVETVSDADGYWKLTGLPPEDEYTVYVQHGTTLLSSFTVPLGVDSITLEDPACSPPDDFKAAVVTGDYDKFAKVLKQIGIENYDIINGKTGSSLVQFLSSEVALRQYSVIFFPGGHLEEDIIYDTDGSDEDGVVSQVLTSLRNYVDAGGVVYASDWSYDVIEQGWPDAVDFLGDDTIPDDAQLGMEAEVTASIEDNTIKSTLTLDAVDISFDLDSWPVMEDIGEDAYVYLSADIPYREGMNTFELLDAPIMIGADYGEGKIVYSSWRQHSNLTGNAKDFIDATISLTTNR